MSTTLLLALVWILAALVAWVISRPSEQEREILNGVGQRELLFSFDKARRRSQWSPEDEGLLLRLRRRSSTSAVVVVGLLGVVALSLSGPDDPADPDAQFIAAHEQASTEPDSQANAEPEAQEQLVRTYRRSPDGEGPPEVVEEYRVETLEEKRDPIRLYGTAKVAAKYDNMQLLGISITNIQPDSFWEMVGFREGDFILEANGELMDNPNTSVAFMSSMHEAPEVIVRVRGSDDVERTLVYSAPRDE